jgi:hypothetical protein
MPLGPETLAIPATLDLGNLRPNEKKTVRLEIRNRALRRVQLEPIKSDCGCIVVNGAPSQLAARESATASITLVAPGAPGAFSRTLLVRPPGQEELAWTVVAKGRVKTDVWAEPSSLDLTYRQSSSPQADLMLRFTEGFKLGDLAASSPHIKFAVQEKNDRGLKLHVHIRVDAQSSMASGNSSVQIYEQGMPARPVLTVPIRWRQAPQIAYIPSRLELPRYGQESAAEGGLRRVLAIVVPPDQSADDAQFTVLVPWVRVARQSKEGSVLRLELEFNGEQMPAHFEQSILSGWLVNDPVRRTLPAIGYRS